MQRDSRALLAAESTVKLLIQPMIREFQHINHLLMEVIQRKLYGVITQRIEKNLVNGGTVRMISYYEWLKKRYRHNYDIAHGLRNRRKDV